MSKTFLKTLLAISLLAISSTTANAGKADVLEATASKSGDSWNVSATVRHADEGWKHYANTFQVLAMDGTVLGTRVLVHPHVDEQPFTRSLGGVQIPSGTTNVRVRAGDLVHGYGGKEVVLELSK